MQRERVLESIFHGIEALDRRLESRELATEARELRAFFGKIDLPLAIHPLDGAFDCLRGLHALQMGGRGRIGLGFGEQPFFVEYRLAPRGLRSKIGRLERLLVTRPHFRERREGGALGRNERLTLRGYL